MEALGSRANYATITFRKEKLFLFKFNLEKTFKNIENFLNRNQQWFDYTVVNSLHGSEVFLKKEDTYFVTVFAKEISFCYMEGEVPEQLLILRNALNNFDSRTLGYKNYCADPFNLRKYINRVVEKINLIKKMEPYYTDSLLANKDYMPEKAYNAKAEIKTENKVKIKTKRRLLL